MTDTVLLWVDDEIDLLKPYIIFLEQKGYVVETAVSGSDALDMIQENHYALVFLDENMPGMNGLEVLSKIKKTHSQLPVVMLTKSEEETIMNEAIGGNIADYLIKPVKPNQILLTIKKILDKQEIVSDTLVQRYQQEFHQLQQEFDRANTVAEWTELYRSLINWELQFSHLPNNTMDEILGMQRKEAGKAFSQFVTRNYYDIINGNVDEPVLTSQIVFKEKLFPLLSEETPTVLILIDNLRFDQWQIIKPLLTPFFRIDDETLFMSILPTVTQYARNAMFSGLMPSEISKLYPDYWFDDEEDEQKNMFEKELLERQLKRFGLSSKFYYAKVFNTDFAERVNSQINQMLQHPLSVVVYNFVDMLSHARTDNPMIRELANDEKAYRSITYSWFRHSPIYDLFMQLAEKKANIVITTDHGSVKVRNPIKVIGDKKTTTNLRYKQGKSLSYNEKEVFVMRNPKDYHLPQPHVSSGYIFARQDDFMAYPNNYNHYVKYYKDTFQHGGISLEEMLIPYVHLTAK
jgi:CheY-like chemotaxis protein